MAARIHHVTQHRSGVAGVEAMTLFSNHVFPRHSHDQFGIGIMTAGAQRSWSIVGHVESVAGDVIMCNPGEMHDGAPGAGSRRPGAGARGWRIMYFDPSLLEDDVSREERGELIVPPVVRDRQLSTHVSRLFRHVESDAPDALAVEETLLACLMRVSQRHRLNGPVSVATSPSVSVAIRRLEDAPEIPISLADLAKLSGVSRFQLLRGFARDVGTTPHAYVIQRRARLARQLLAAGTAPTDAAALAGFADQSHMSRAFVKHFGITPARYRNFVQDR
ncbi:MAG TPA: AraC family transcriptional regulator [Vicinamibacterales bacterium]